MDVKIQGVPYDFSRGVYLKVYFPWGLISTVTFFQVGDWKFFSGIIFFIPGIESTKIQFQGIYESNNHSGQVPIGI